MLFLYIRNNRRITIKVISSNRWQAPGMPTVGLFGETEQEMQHKPLSSFLPEFNAINFSKQAPNFASFLPEFNEINFSLAGPKERAILSVCLPCLLASRRVSSWMFSLQLVAILPGSNSGPTFLFIYQVLSKHLIYVRHCSRHWGYNRTEKVAILVKLILLWEKTDYNQVS